MRTQRLTLNSTNKTGRILTITFAMALLGALGFIVWQNFIYHEPAVEKISTGTTASSGAKIKTDPSVKGPALPDMIDYGSGIKIATQSDLTKLTNAPATLSSYLYGVIEQANATGETDGCTTVITVKKVYKQLYATGGVGVTGNGCGGGYAALWGDTESSWKKLAGSQNDGFGCNDLTKYKVPAAIAGATCIDGTHPEGRSYTQE